jgi:translation elongation factor EF-Tu-like GTPase
MTFYSCREKTWTTHAGTEDRQIFVFARPKVIRPHWLYAATAYVLADEERSLNSPRLLSRSPIYYLTDAE